MHRPDLPLTAPRSRRQFATGVLAAAALTATATAAAACGGTAPFVLHHRPAVVTAPAGGFGPNGAPSAGAAPPSAAAGAGLAALGAGSAGSSGPAAAAWQALGRYAGAIITDDPAALVASADQAPLALGGILVDSAAINRDRNATTTMRVTSGSLVPLTIGAASVTFAGMVTLATTISGPKGSGTFDDTISAPVVTDEAGTWRVTDFTYDGQPITVRTQHVSRTVNGLHVAVGYVVSYGNVTAVLVTLSQATGAANVQLRSCSLNLVNGTAVSGVGDFTAPPTPTGVLRFSRIGVAPSSLALHFVAADGQVDDFLVPLS